MIKDLKIGSLLGACQLIEQGNLANVFCLSESRVIALQLPFIISHSNLDGNLHLYTVIPNGSNADVVLHKSATITAIFNGPNSYISPTWYANSNNVIEWNNKSLTIIGKLQLDEDNKHQLMQLFVEQMEDKVDRSPSQKVNISEIVAASIEQYQILEFVIEQFIETNEFGKEKEIEQKIQISRELKKQSNMNSMLLAFEIEETLKKKR